MGGGCWRRALGACGFGWAEHAGVLAGASGALLCFTHACTHTPAHTHARTHTRPHTHTPAGDYGIGDVISLLWFKRKLPKYATKFIEVRRRVRVCGGRALVRAASSPTTCAAA